MNSEKSISPISNTDELTKKGASEIQKKGRFSVDALRVDDETIRPNLDSVYKKPFDTIEELRETLQLNGLQMADMPRRSDGNGSNYANIDVYRNGVKVAVLGIKASGSLEVDHTPELTSTENPKLPETVSTATEDASKSLD